MSTMPTTQPAVRPRRRWWRIILLTITALVLTVAGFWAYTVWSTRTAWAEAEAEAALDLARWRLLELEEDRPNVPEEENSALLMIALRQKGGASVIGLAPNFEKIFENLPPTAQLNQQQSDIIRGRLPKIVEEARS